MAEYPKPVQTTYTSDEVNIPHDFLMQRAYDAESITLNQIDFKQTVLPEYDGCFAVILENVLSPSECKQLVQLVEQSAKSQGWKPAMVNMGGNYEVMATDYRNSDRIIWDSPEIVDRLWKRCLQATGMEEKLSKVAGNKFIQGESAVKRGEAWNFSKVNERMRFLRYGPGQYFEPHCDGSYVKPDSDGRERTLMTLHLYLTSNDGLKGGATTFHSPDTMFKGAGKELRVVPRLGRVLIFQHRSLLHSGETLRKGSATKITMRTDLMYRMVQPPSPN